MDDDHLREQWTRIQASHKKLVAAHSRLEEAAGVTAGMAVPPDRAYLDKLKAHLEALREHREILRAYHVPPSTSPTKPKALFASTGSTVNRGL
jgi:hypothetical protein